MSLVIKSAATRGNCKMKNDQIFTFFYCLDLYFVDVSPLLQTFFCIFGHRDYQIWPFEHLAFEQIQELNWKLQNSLRIFRSMHSIRREWHGVFSSGKFPDSILPDVKCNWRGHYQSFSDSNAFIGIEMVNSHFFIGTGSTWLLNVLYDWTGFELDNGPPSL